MHLQATYIMLQYQIHASIIYVYLVHGIQSLAVASATGSYAFNIIVYYTAFVQSGISILKTQFTYVLTN